MRTKKELLTCADNDEIRLLEVLIDIRDIMKPVEAPKPPQEESNTLHDRMVSEVDEEIREESKLDETATKDYKFEPNNTRLFEILKSLASKGDGDKYDPISAYKEITKSMTNIIESSIRADERKKLYKALNERDSKMYGYYKSVFDDGFELGYPAEWDEPFTK